MPLGSLVMFCFFKPWGFVLRIKNVYATQDLDKSEIGEVWLNIPRVEIQVSATKSSGQQNSICMIGFSSIMVIAIL